MAKKRPKEIIGQETPEEVVARMVEGITTRYGNVVIQGDDFVNADKKSVALSPAFTQLMNGPFLEGSIIGLTGNEKTGKTITALSFAAKAQQAGRQIIYGIAESRASREHMKAVQGIDWGKAIVIESTKEKILTAQEELAIYLELLKNIPGCVVIIDSISGMVHEKEMTDGIETELRGGMARLFSKFISQARKYVTVNDSYLIGITHLICDTGNPMAGKQEKVARAWKYMCDYQLRAISSTHWQAGEKTIGLKVNWLNKTSRNGAGPPGMKVDTYLRFGVGVDGLFELLEYAKAIKLIKTAGAWYTLEWMKRYPELLGLEEWSDKHESKIKAQGAQAVYDLAVANPAWIDALKKELSQFLGEL